MTEIKTIVNIQIVDISRIKPNSYNPKDKVTDNPENRKQLDNLKKAIVDLGMVKPVDVREVGNDFEIIDGEHRYLALLELGVKQVPINNFGIISDDEARVRTISEDVIKIPINEIKMAEVLQQIKDAEILRKLPYTAEEIAEKIKMLTFDWDQYQQNDLPTNEKAKQDATCPECGFEFKI